VSAAQRCMDPSRHTLMHTHTRTRTRPHIRTCTVLTRDIIRVEVGITVPLFRLLAAIERIPRHHRIQRQTHIAHVHGLEDLDRAGGGLRVYICMTAEQAGETARERRKKRERERDRMADKERERQKQERGKEERGRESA